MRHILPGGERATGRALLGWLTMRENTGPAIAIAGILTAGYVVWASVIVILMWLALTVYAIVQWIGGDQHADPTIVLLIMVANITLFVLLLYVGVYFIGRSMQYKKRDRKGETALDAVEAQQTT
jgi:hypothetical protein